MATRFAQQFSRFGVDALLRQFGETITYYAGGVGSGLEIQALIQRDVSVVDESGQVIGQSTVMRVKDDATTGVAADAIDTIDEVSFELRVDETPQRKVVARVIGTDNGFVRFEVQ